MLSLVFNYTHEINTHLYFFCTATRPRDIKVELSRQVRWERHAAQLHGRALHFPAGVCAAVVRGLPADIAVMYSRSSRKPQTHCCSVSALAIGTSTHGDRHLPFSSNPFYTSSPDDKSYFPYRHSEKELGEKQLKKCQWVEHLSPISLFPIQNAEMIEWFNERGHI